MRVMRGSIAAVAMLAHVFTVGDILWPGGHDRQERRAVEALGALPDGAWAIRDEPGFLWRAGLRVPHDLVDTSILRIQSDRLTPASVVAAADDPRVCAVLVWSHRFGDMDLAARLRGYQLTADFGPPRALFTKTDCEPRSHGAATARRPVPTGRWPAGAAPGR